MSGIMWWTTGWSLRMLTSKSKKRVWWKCALGHAWKTSVCHRANGTTCPYCKGKKILTGFNDLATLYPELADEWVHDKNYGLAPCTISPGSHKMVWWRGTLCGHLWEAVVYERSHGTGCPYCQNKKVLAGFNDLAFLEPEIAAEWHLEKNGELKPTDVTSGSDYMVWWKCIKGHIWQSKVITRTLGNNCPVCNGQKCFL